MPAYWSSWVKLCDHFGLRFSEKRFYSMSGIPVKDIVQTLLSEKNDVEESQMPSLEEVLSMKKELGMKAHEDYGIPAIDVVVDVARKYHGKIPLAVASSGFRQHVHSSLRSNGIFELFDAIVTAEDIQNPKPAPDIFLEAARRLGVDPRKCRAYEDADIGLQSIKAAGMEGIDARQMEGYPAANASAELVGTTNKYLEQK